MLREAGHLDARTTAQVYAEAVSSLVVKLSILGYELDVARKWRGYEAYRKEIDDAITMMGRHGRQNMIELDRSITLRQLNQWLDSLDRLITREHEAAHRR